MSSPTLQLSPSDETPTEVVPYAMLIITTPFDQRTQVLQAIQQRVPSVIQTISNLTQKCAHGCLIIDVSLPDLSVVEHLLDTMPDSQVLDYITVCWDTSLEDCATLQ